MANANRTPEQWATRIGVIMAVAGSAVGLGNLLRFPGQAAQNGGGAFMLPYFISLLILGIPLCWAEWTMGRYGGTKGFNSAPGVFTAIWPHRASKYFGGLALLIPLVIYMYYVLLEAWCFGYAVHYLTGDMQINQPAIAAAQEAGTEQAANELGRVSRYYLQAASLKQEDMLREKRGELEATGLGEADIQRELQSTEFLAEVDAQVASVVATESNRRSYAFNKFFARLVGSEVDGVSLEGADGILLASLIGVFLTNFWLIYRGVSKGIETFCRIAMPVMAVLAIIVLIRVLTLGTPDPDHPDQSVMGGLAFMWNPHPEKLRDPKTWLAAAGQIFFTLSVGFGVIINYASYLRKQDDVVLSGLTATSVNEFFEVCLGGMITIPAAFIFLGVAAGGMGTFDLGFKALPNVFAMMPGGQFIGCLWFFMLFIAAITSSVSMLQPVIAFFEEGLGLRRHASATLLGLISALGCGFVMYFSKGLVALDTMDFWVGSVLIFLLGLLQSLLYGWVLGIDRGEREAHHGAQLRIPRFVQYVLKYVTPSYLLIIFGLFCWNNLPDYYASIMNSNIAKLTIGFIAVVLLFLMLLIRIAGTRWENEGRFAHVAGYPAPGMAWLAWFGGAVVALGGITFATIWFRKEEAATAAADLVSPGTSPSPMGWAAMTISIVVVLSLVGYCLSRVLKLPPVEVEQLTGPLEIDTGDTENAD